jgi:hypothetical protein
MQLGPFLKTHYILETTDLQEDEKPFNDEGVCFYF